MARGEAELPVEGAAAAAVVVEGVLLLVVEVVVVVARAEVRRERELGSGVAFGDITGGEELMVIVVLGGGEGERMMMDDRGDEWKGECWARVLVLVAVAEDEEEAGGAGGGRECWENFAFDNDVPGLFGRGIERERLARGLYGWVLHGDQACFEGLFYIGV